ncbi:MAG: signal recognition particle-docking protein FtsY [Propionibacteriaceae bacterium]|nr:signal recognition particle-docking protein FtsY [Propionibacteriaceae bacterium]
MDWISWLIVAGVIAAIIAAGVIVFISNRRHARELEPPAKPVSTEIPPAPAEPAAAPEPVAPPVAPVDSTAVDVPVSPHTPPASPEESSVPAVETPESSLTRFARLRRRLASSNNYLARGLATLLASDHIDEATWDDFEATLIASDLGVGPSTELVSTLRRKLAIDGVSDPVQARSILRSELIALVDPSLDRSLSLTPPPDSDGPAVVLVVGVNGTGKTTTVGKLARLLVSEGRTVTLGAADTFRAAAADQLTTWGERIGVETVRGPEQADPASVAFDAAKSGQDAGADIVIVDTAGRLHTKVGLMDELGKVKRVIQKVAPVTETLLVLDATTGQNGLTQARVFADAVDITGVVLTKLDGSAKGGIVVQVQRELGVPVKLIGLGEGADDLAPFDVEQFVDGLLGD